MHLLAPQTYTDFPPEEALAPRIALIRTLTDVVSKLCQTAEGAVSVFNMVDGEKACERVKVVAKNLWVIGDIANGCSRARRLELLLDYDAPHVGLIDQGQVAYALFGFHVNVRIHAGRPEMNSTGIYCTEAFKVWGTGVEPVVAISQLAGKEPTQCSRTELPLAPEQLKLGLIEQMAIVEKIKSGVLQSTFIPFDELGDPVFWGECTDLEQEVLALACSSFPAEVAKLTPLVMAYLYKKADALGIHAQTEINTEEQYFQHGGAFVFPGPAATPVPAMLDDIRVTSIAYVPLLNFKGPNGIWVLERGANHPLVRAFDGVCAWTTGCLEGYLHPNTAWTTGMDAEITCLRLHQSSDAVMADLEEEDDDEGRGTSAVVPWKPVFLEGDLLLAALGQADVVAIDNDYIALTAEALPLQDSKHKSLAGVIARLSEFTVTREPSVPVQQYALADATIAKQQARFTAALPELDPSKRRLPSGAEVFVCAHTAAAWDVWLKCYEANRHSYNTN